MHKTGANIDWPVPWPFNHTSGLYRFLSGRPLNGHRYTDATFLRHGTMATDLSGHASRWQLWPGWKRAAVSRWPLLSTPGLLVLWWTQPLAIFWLLAIAVTLAIPPAVSTFRGRVHRREVIEPLAITLAKIFNKRHVHGHGWTWVDIPRDFLDNPAAVATVSIPVQWPGDKGEMARVERAVSTRLSTPDLVANWDLSGRCPVVQFSRPERPVDKVSLAEIMIRLSSLSSDELAMGLAARGLATFDLASESPHLLIAGGSGAGKSVLLAFLTGQFMRRGYGIVVLDAKFVSHMWLRRVPGVLYAAESPELHEALLWLDAELMRRARLVATGGDPAGLVPLVVVAEEMNGATNRLRAYWATIKATGDPMMSPALTALANLSSMGRELRMHILMAGQSMTSKATGGVENRENFGGRALARATANQWRMLAPQIKPAPLKRGKPGRWHLVVGDVLKEFQVPFIDLKEPARVIEWATDGLPIPDVPAMQAGLVVDAEQGEHSEPSTTTCTLPEFATAYGIELKRLENWRSQRREEFPASVGKRGAALLYDWEALDQFMSARKA